MGTQSTLIYRVDALGISSTKLQPFVASAPIPLDVLQALGLRILSDTITIPATNPIVRTIVLGFDPSAAALATTAISNTSNIDRVIVDPVNDGLDYILPPIVRANNNAREPLEQIVQGNTIGRRPTNRDAILKSWMNVKAAAVDSPGAGYLAPIVTFLGGLPPAGAVFDARRGFRGGCVRYINIADPGEGYDPATARLNIQGGGPGGNTPAIPAVGILALDPRGRVASIAIVDMGSGYDSVPDVFITTTTGIAARRQAKMYAVMAEGSPARGTAVLTGAPPSTIASITITARGDNYNTVPTILIRDAAGVGAIAHARMALGRVDVVDEGVGYFPGTSLAITPVFQELFPTDPTNAQAQNAAFFQFLQGTISQIAITPLRSDVPLVA